MMDDREGEGRTWMLMSQPPMEKLRLMEEMLDREPEYLESMKFMRQCIFREPPDTDKMPRMSPEEIEREMDACVQWNPDVCRDRTVLLPCENSENSGFTQYFMKNFNRLGLKKLVAVSPVKTGEEHGALFIAERTADGVNKLRGRLRSGGFQSPEAAKLRDEADFIVAEPPAGRLAEFMDWVQQNTPFKQYIVVNADIWYAALPQPSDVYGKKPETPIERIQRLSDARHGLGVPACAGETERRRMLESMQENDENEINAPVQ